MPDCGIQSRAQGSALSLCQAPEMHTNASHVMKCTAVQSILILDGILLLQAASRS